MDFNTTFFIFLKTAQGYWVRQRLIVVESIIRSIGPNSRLTALKPIWFMASEIISTNKDCNNSVGRSLNRREIWEALKDSTPICLLNRSSLKLLLISRKFRCWLSWAQMISSNNWKVVSFFTYLSAPKVMVFFCRFLLKIGC